MSDETETGDRIDVRDETGVIRTIVIPPFSEETVRYLDERMEAARWDPESRVAKTRYGGAREPSRYRGLKPRP